MRKKTFEEVEKEVTELGNNEYEVKPPYKGSKVKMEFIHKTCGNHFMMKFNAFQGGQRCPKCGKKHSAIIRSKSPEEFVKQVDDFYGKGEYTVLTDYVNSDTLVKVKHNKCGNVYMSRPADLIRGHGCQKCAYVTRASKVGVNQRTPLEEVQDSLHDLIGDGYTILTSPEEYKGNRQHIVLRHEKCGHTFRARYADIKQYHHGCPFCSPSSSAETKILSILESDLGLKANEDFYYAYIVPDLKYKSNLHFDFYFKDSKVAIEYDGKQHYFPCEYFGGIDSFYDTQLRDSLKTQYCANNKILLFRIPYTITSYTSLKSTILSILKYTNMSGSNK